MHIDFADAFGAAHHVGWVNRLVGGNHDELLDAIFHAEVGNHLRAPDVVLHAFARVVFHHRHVLVGGGVENIVGLKLVEDFLHAVFLANARHHGVRRDVWIFVFHHQADVVLRRLCLVDEHHFRRFVNGNLSHHLRADTSSRPRDEHFFAAEQCANLFHVHFDFVAWQEVFDFHLAELYVLVDILVFAPSLSILGDVDFHAGTDERVLQFAVVDKHFVFERAHENGFDAFVLDDFHDVFLRGIDALAHEALVIVWLGVSDVAFDGELHRFDVACLVGYGDGTSVRAVDEGALRFAAHPQAFKNRLDHHARDTHEECRAQIDDDNHAAREDEEIIVPSDLVDEEVEHLCQYERKGTGVEHLQ